MRSALTECDYLCGSILYKKKIVKKVVYAKIPPKMVDLRDIAGKTEDEEEW